MTSTPETNSTVSWSLAPAPLPETGAAGPPPDARAATDRPVAASNPGVDCVVERVRATLDDLQRLAEAWNSSDDAPPRTPVLNFGSDFLLSIVVPVYNERATIRALLGRLLAIRDIPKEVIVVDDGSTDGTRDELVQLVDVPGLRIILKPENAGKGAALRTGFSYAQGQIVMVQDADLEYDPRDIPSLLQPILDHEADVVYGSRFLELRGRGSSGIHRMGNRLLTWVSNATTGLRLTDMETCYKVFHAEVLRDLVIRQNRFGFEPEVTAKVARRGWRVAELPVRYDARDWHEGKKIGWRDAVNALYCILRYAWRD